MKILVTGGAGFIGSNLVDELIDCGHAVVVVDNLSTGFKEYINKEAVFYNLGLNSSKLGEIIKTENISHIIHHAAQIDVQKSVSDPAFDARNNILGTINLLEAAADNVKKIIYASSAAVYGSPLYLPVDEDHSVNPMSPYGISKHTPEHYFRIYSRVHGLKYTILRYANVYGPRQDPRGEGGVVSNFVDNMLDNRCPIIYGDGEQTRDFIYVKDIISANKAALTRGDNDIFNISCNIKYSINDLYDIINDILNTNLSPRYKKAKKGDIRHSILDNSRATEVLDWKPEYTLKQGLKETIAYYARKLEAE